MRGMRCVCVRNEGVLDEDERLLVRREEVYERWRGNVQELMRVMMRGTWVFVKWD